jgi:hypothetical protein
MNLLEETTQLAIDLIKAQVFRLQSGYQKLKHYNTA